SPRPPSPTEAPQAELERRFKQVAEALALLDTRKNRNKFNNRPAAQPPITGSVPAPQASGFNQVLEQFSSQVRSCWRTRLRTNRRSSHPSPRPPSPTEAPQAELERRFKQVAEALALLDTRK
ncbi:hypothetical protein CTI14_51635, partial [Methylobacterium radiotolerans]